MAHCLLETETNTQETRPRPILFAKATIITHYKSQPLTVIDHVASPRVMAQFDCEFVILGSEVREHARNAGKMPSKTDVVC